MSNENNDNIDKSSDSREETFLYLRRRLPPELIMDIKRVTFFDSNDSDESINKSSLNNIESHLLKYDCAVISSFKDELDEFISIDIPEEVKCIIENIDRNKSLSAALLYFGYGVSKVNDSLIENYLKNNFFQVLEDSFFVVNINNTTDFKETITELGKIFCQENILIMEKGGGNNYLVGTSNSINPDSQNITTLGKFKLNINPDIIRLDKKRKFFIETFKSSQINSKRIITEWGRPIVNMIRNK